MGALTNILVYNIGENINYVGPINKHRTTKEYYPRIKRYENQDYHRSRK